jgi:hypothetical protein
MKQLLLLSLVFVLFTTTIIHITISSVIVVEVVFAHRRGSCHGLRTRRRPCAGPNSSSSKYYYKFIC